MIPTLTDGIRFNINNGGVSFSVVERVGEDEYKDGTYLVVSVEHFGIRTNLIELPVTHNGLSTLGRYITTKSKEGLKLFHTDAIIPRFSRIDKEKI